MSESVSTKTPAIAIMKNGPYVVSGDPPLAVQSIEPGTEGGSWSWAEGRTFPVDGPYALCRCGLSAQKPFCDGTHAKAGFDGTETAYREPYDARAKTIDGPTRTLEDVDALCAFARFCDNAGGIWTSMARSDEPAVDALVVREATSCPSGRLVLRAKPSGEAVEPEFAPSLVLVEDPEKHSSGPLWVRGGIAVTSSDGTAYETRNRVTLCRCGRSSNKPFCDGTHADVGFDDGMIS